MFLRSEAPIPATYGKKLVVNIGFNFVFAFHFAQTGYSSGVCGIPPHLFRNNLISMHLHSRIYMTRARCSRAPNSMLFHS
jgi:hypothetical protein